MIGELEIKKGEEKEEVRGIGRIKDRGKEKEEEEKKKEKEGEHPKIK